MRGIAALLAALLMLTLLPLGPTASASDANWWKRRPASKVVVANRDSGDISVINTRTFDVETYDLPGDAEPMYVNHDRRNDIVLVGDRASSTVVAFDDRTYDIVGSVAVGGGIFHQWVDDRIGQMWVVGDTSQTITVVDTRSLSVIETIDMPPELVALNARPHDVFVKGRHAFVTTLGADDGVGRVIQYSTSTFEETNRITVGDDPHVFVRNGRLYVASQNTSTIASYWARSMRPVNEQTVTSAHGLWVTWSNRVFVSSITEGGTEAVTRLDRRLRPGPTLDTHFPVPHNLTVDDRGQLYVTHSGPLSNQVSVSRIRWRSFGQPKNVTVGVNPFGLAFVSSR